VNFIIVLRQFTFASVGQNNSKLCTATPIELAGMLIPKSWLTIEELKLDKNQRKIIPCYLFVIRNFKKWHNKPFFDCLCMLHYPWVILHAIAYINSHHGVSYVLHTCLHGICCRWSKSIDSRKVRNESRCFVISCCLLAGQCPAFMAFFFIFCRCGSSRVHW